MKHLQQRDLFNREHIIQNKIKNHTISQLDIKELNDIDESITLGCLNADQSLKIVQASHPWSPTQATSILCVQLWNCVKTKLNKFNQRQQNNKYRNKNTII